MTVLAATTALLELVEMSAQVTTQMQRVSAMIAQAQAEGRTTLTDDERVQLKTSDDAARAALVAAIAAAPASA